MEEAKYGLPKCIFTDNSDDATENGNVRLKVDNAHTEFYQGKQFRTYKEISLSNNQVYLIKIESPIDFILQKLEAHIDKGSVRISTHLGGTPTGTFSEIMPIIPKNAMSTRPTPYYQTQLTLTAVPTGGTLTGGIELDVIRAVASTLSEVGSVSSDIDSRGVGAATYYVKIQATSTGTTGVIRALWSEQ